MVETITSGLTDEFPSLGEGNVEFRKFKIPKRMAFTIGICIFMFLLGLPMTTRVSL
mgnify:CR=1 FL=1